MPCPVGKQETAENITFSPLYNLRQPGDGTRQQTWALRQPTTSINLPSHVGSRTMIPTAIPTLPSWHRTVSLGKIWKFVTLSYVSVLPRYVSTSKQTHYIYKLIPFAPSYITILVLSKFYGKCLTRELCLKSLCKWMCQSKVKRDFRLKGSKQALLLLVSTFSCWCTNSKTPKVLNKDRDKN